VEDLDVRPDATLVDVFQTKLILLPENLIEIHLIRITFPDSCLQVVVRQRREIRHARQYGQAASLLIGVFLNVGRHFWPGPNKAHIAGNDIDELRQLINLHYPERPPEWQEARIIACRGGSPKLVRVLDHGAKLAHPNRMPAFPNPNPSVQDRTAVHGIHHEPAHHPDRERGYRDRDSHETITNALRDLVGPHRPAKCPRLTFGPTRRLKSGVHT
jgi:hypothetical protein